MMTSDKIKVAVLVANGFKLDDLIKVQKVMTDIAVGMKIVSVNHGLVNAWDDEVQGWGHNFAVDQHLNTALGADYDVLIIPGGRRSTEKLKMTAHTRRFISSFMAANKPVAVMGDALEIVNYVNAADARNVSAAEEDSQLDMNLLTGRCDEAYFEKMKSLLVGIDLDQAA